MKLARRMFLQQAGLAGISALCWPAFSAAQTALAAAPIHLRSIPSSGERIPVLGLGSWITFDVPPGDSVGRQRSIKVIQRFLDAGGCMIDSSPMYGNAQEVIGLALRDRANAERAFSATKVWIPGARLGEEQMEQALDLWGLQQFDLLHVHNMLDWQKHLPWMMRWRDSGKIRYLGITTSHGRRHKDMAEVIRNEPFDFVQFTYNMVDREAEDILLPLAQQHGKAVVINRPFDGGALFRRVRNRPLPAWAADLECSNWAQFFLSWVISHPAVTCAIPATSNPDHLDENRAVLRSPLPNEEQRKDMLKWFLAT